VLVLATNFRTYHFCVDIVIAVELLQKSFLIVVAPSVQSFLVDEVLLLLTILGEPPEAL